MISAHELGNRISLLEYYRICKHKFQNSKLTLPNKIGLKRQYKIKRYLTSLTIDQKAFDLSK